MHLVFHMVYDWKEVFNFSWEIVELEKPWNADESALSKADIHLKLFKL